MQYYSSSAPVNNIYMIQDLDNVQPINSKYILTIHNYFDFQGFPFGLETRATSGTSSIHCSLPYFVTINWKSLFLTIVSLAALIASCTKLASCVSNVLGFVKFRCI